MPLQEKLAAVQAEIANAEKMRARQTREESTLIEDEIRDFIDRLYIDAKIEVSIIPDRGGYTLRVQTPSGRPDIGISYLTPNQTLGVVKALYAVR